MSFWKSDRIEYLRQPHVVVFIIFVFALLSFVVFSSYSRIKELNRQENLGLEDKCLSYIDDDILCKYVAASQNQESNNYKSVSTETTDDVVEITTITSSGTDSVSSQTIANNQPTNEYVLLGDTTYAKDYSDGYWAKFVDTSYEPTEQDSLYDFSSNESEDVIAFRGKYKKIGTETCGELTCYKYQIIDANSENTLTYIWFDNQSYLLRKYTSQDDASKIEIMYSYGGYTVSPPEPVKDATEEEIVNLLGI